MVIKPYIADIIERLTRGQKLRHAAEYWSLFWSMFDSENCAICKSVRRDCKPDRGTMTTDRREMAKNIDAGKCLGRCAPRTQKLQLLQAIAGINFSKPDYGTRQDRREKFNKHWSLEAVSGLECFICGEPAHHRHHIVQLQHGGKNCRRNQAPLCRSCHREVHK